MLKLWERFWKDEAFASNLIRSAWRYAGALLAVLVSWGVIPTGVDGGQKYGIAILAAIAVISSRTSKSIDVVVERKAETVVAQKVPEIVPAVIDQVAQVIDTTVRR